MIEFPEYEVSVGVCIGCERETTVRLPIWSSNAGVIEGYAMVSIVAGERMELRGPLCDLCYAAIYGGEE